MLNWSLSLTRPAPDQNTFFQFFMHLYARFPHVICRMAFIPWYATCSPFKPLQPF